MTDWNNDPLTVDLTAKELAATATPFQLKAQIALDLERIADALERIADHFNPE